MFCKNCRMKSENEINTNIIKRKKLQWWIPLLFFVWGLVLNLVNITAVILLRSSEEFVDYQISDYPILMIVGSLAWICWLLVIPSLIIVVVKHNKKTPLEKEQNNI